jgi:hypothetical protein
MQGPQRPINTPVVIPITTLVYDSRPIWGHNPAFLLPPPWFWLVALALELVLLVVLNTIVLYIITKYFFAKPFS